MKIEITGNGVTHGSRTLNIGDTIELDANSCNSLIDAQLAKLSVAENVAESPKGLGTVIGDDLPTHAPENPASDQQEDDSGNKNEISTEEVEKLKKVLNDQYKRDELYEAAIKSGVEVAYDARKADIVEAIVTFGKANELIK